LLVVAVAAAGVVGCTDSITPVDEFPTFYGTWAGERWIGDASAALVGDTLFIGARTPTKSSQSPKETFTAKVIIHGAGTYLLGAGDARLDELVGGDVVAASYTTTATSVGRVTITSYHGINGMVEGTIEFDAETSSPYGSYGSKASMKDAFFSAVVRSLTPH
jgi:hypothetical protein